MIDFLNSVLRRLAALVMIGLCVWAAYGFVHQIRQTLAGLEFWSMVASALPNGEAVRTFELRDGSMAEVTYGSHGDIERMVTLTRLRLGVELAVMLGLAALTVSFLGRIVGAWDSYRGTSGTTARRFAFTLLIVGLLLINGLNLWAGFAIAMNTEAGGFAQPEVPLFLGVGLLMLGGGLHALFERRAP